MIQTRRTCLFCNEKLVGRADKRFCNDYCRNTYNNKKAPSGVRMITQAISHNKTILETLAGRENFGIFPLHQLIENGFSFSYFTHICESPEKEKWWVCYDIGYQLLPDGNLTIRRINPDDKVLSNIWRRIGQNLSGIDKKIRPLNGGLIRIAGTMVFNIYRCPCPWK